MLSQTQLNIDWQSIPWSTPLPAEAVAIWEEMSRVDREAPVFTRHEWLELAAQAGAITPWGIIVVRRNQQAVGLFPLRKRSLWTWEMLAFFSQDNPQMLIDPEHEEMAWTGLARWMAKTPAVGALSLGACSDARRVERFQRIFREQQLHVKVTPLAVSSVHSRLAANWQEFLGIIEPSHRKDLLRAERLLFRDFADARIEYLTDPDACLETLEEMICLYRRRWGETAGGCIFDNPRNVAFYRAAVHWAVKNGFAAVSTLRARGRLIVAGTKFHIPGQDMLFEQFIIRVPDILPNRYSPGLVESCHSVRWAMSLGVKTINQGAGALPYKLMFNGSAIPLQQVTAVRGRVAGLACITADRALHIIKRLPVHIRHHLELLFHHYRQNAR